jgi:hypothetical protein
VLAVLAFEPFAEHSLQLLASREPLPCSCIGPRDARLNVVYLHGFDTYGPSWTEIATRRKLHEIADALHVRIALPRTRGSWARHLDEIGRAGSVCFNDPRSFVILGFSDGANAANELFFDCVGARVISVGSSSGAVSRSRALAGCGQLILIAGEHEPGFATTKLMARRLAAQHADVRFFAHSGPHEVPLRETLAALRSFQ